MINKEDLKEPYIVTKDLEIKNIPDFKTYYKEMNNSAKYLEELTSNIDFIKLLEFANALASDIRLKILHFVYLGKVTCFCELESIFKLKKSTLNYHIKLLNKSGLVQTSKKGKVIVISIGKEFDNLMSEDLKKSFIL